MPHPVGYLLRAVAGIPRKARQSLYAGKQVDVVHRVSRDYEVKSKKLRKPNVVKASLYSQALGEFVRLKVTTTALRQIDKAGGLDRYLLKTPDSLLFSDVGSKLKFRLGLTYRHKQYQERQQQLLQQQQQLLPDSAALQKAARLAANSSSSSSKGRTSLLPPAAAAALQANQ
eukprot:GHUV01012416.1.p1 GENE.GHUV01012416.1~~GHUV01012416.1.p1  ORF type:complete len:172 (+),score=57.93 GHUV01012416.1:728-1243(+)